MSKTRKVGIALTVMLVATVGIALGQGFGGGFGGFGGFNRPGQLIGNQDVAKELKIDAELAKKLDAAILKAISGVLDEDQSKRFRQITLQVSGFQAFADAKVQEELKFTDEQKDSIKKILADNAEKVKEIQAEGFGGFAKFGPLMKETQAKVTELLTDAQKDQYKEILGAKFEFTQFKFKFKKKDE